MYMKIKSKNIYFFLIALFLMNTVFQSVHTVLHVKSHLSLGHNVDFQVKYFSPKIDFSFLKLGSLENHEHSDCDICNFVLGYFVAPTPFFIPFTSLSTTLSFPFITPEIPSSFEGSLFSYRGPPQRV
jgi:hypothetical protein